MPAVVTKTEGRSNRTSIMNIIPIAEALQRPLPLLVKVSPVAKHFTPRPLPRHTRLFPQFLSHKFGAAARVDEKVRCNPPAVLCSV